ncbi:MAG TPA: EAL domain-containing protein [Xanthomonadaceae bacterium]|nr:EAL domain-containing protein [Xanthomonadaceae bacterium]
MAAARIQLEPGQVLFREGDPPGSAFLIEHGRLEITTTRQGDSIVLGRLGAGDLLGEMAVIDDAPRTATVTALEASSLLVIDRGQIADRLANADPIIRGLLESQLTRYRGGLKALTGAESGIQGRAPGPRSRRAALAGVSKMRLDAQLREALDSEQLEVRYQPVLSVHSGTVAGFEALIRWTHPERGPISPAEFIALAEETSLIVPVGEYVIDAACRALVAFRGKAGQQLPFIAINVSPRQLGAEGLIERIVERFRALSLPPGAIKVEITESQALSGPDAEGVMRLCREHGIGVALDDFGTGYSNLAHLHELRFDTVKIDQAFARNMMESTRAMAIIESIVAMVHALEAEALVEGIETEDQLQVLRRLGCRYAQGYLIGKPLTLVEALERV